MSDPRPSVRGMRNRGALIVDVLLWSVLASMLLAVGGGRWIGPLWADAACVLAGSMLAVLAVWRAWGLRSGRAQGEGGRPAGEGEHLAVHGPRRAG